MPQVMYVVSMEHYHFPPNDSDMVASTALATSDGLTGARLFANQKATDHAKKWQGEVKEYRNGNREHRYWVESKNANMDKFVWVVRVVDVIGADGQVVS